MGPEAHYFGTNHGQGTCAQIATDTRKKKKKRLSDIKQRKKKKHHNNTGRESRLANPSISQEQQHDNSANEEGHQRQNPGERAKNVHRTTLKRTHLPIDTAEAASCSILGYDSENTRQNAPRGVLPILVRIMYSRSTRSVANVSEYIPRSNTDCAICSSEARST